MCFNGGGSDPAPSREERTMSEQPVLPLAERIDPKTTALVVVDVQNDFCHADGLIGKLGADMTSVQEMIPRLMLLVDAARGAGAPVIWLRLVNAEYTTSDVAHDQRRRTRPGTDLICKAGTWGAELYRVEPADGEPIIQKRRYSGFVDTELELILRSRGIKALVVTGVATNVCVESTARDAYMRDYYVVLVEDCSAAYDPARHTATLRNVDDHFGLVVRSDDVFAAWSPSAPAT
jgi:ureidoacrylate peracid hydrolase